MSDSKFLTGLVLGAIGGVLFAPASGKETRDEIADATMSFRNDFQKKMDKIRKDYKESNDLSFDDLKKVFMNPEVEEKEEVMERITELETSVEQKYKDLEKEIIRMVEDFKMKNDSSILKKHLE